MFFGGGYGHDDDGEWEDETTGQESGEKKEVNTTQHYELLEITKDATNQHIKKAFRKKALKQHPDKGGDPERFKRLKEAYDTLLDPEKRQLYDQYGEEGVKNGGPPGMGGNIFDFFKQGRQDNKPKKMKPKLVKLDVTLQQVFSGTKKEVKVTRYRVCTDCDGKGGSKVEKCGDCKGNGVTVKLMQLGPVMYTQAQARCQKCEGSGEKIAEQAKCKGCDGKKVKQQQKTLEVIVQPGVPDQHDYVFHGESDQLPGIMAGDVFVRIEIQKHEKYERKGADLHYHIQITLLEAITGVTRKIVHLDGKEYLVATAPGEILANKEPKTLNRMGMPFYKDAYSHGNMYFDFKVVFPPSSSLKTDQEQVLRKVFNYQSHNKGLEKKDNTIVLQDFSEDLLNPKASKPNPDQQQEEQEGHPQGIQCQQQ